jgi:hypothetical protein
MVLAVAVPVAVLRRLRSQARSALRTVSLGTDLPARLASAEASQARPHGGPAAIIGQVREAERNDPTGKRWP